MGGWADGRIVITVLLLSGNPATAVRAQDTIPGAPPIDTIRRSADPPIRPMAAFWRSLVLPGWGQAVTGRHTTGAAFVAWEGVTAMMTLKAQQEANYLKSIGSANTSAKRQEVEDWLVLWVFNHLFAGAEAYVSAHLQDFPADLEVRAFPGGIGIRVPLP